MPEFAKLNDEDEILEFRQFDRKPGDPVGKGWRWLAVVETKPSFNAGTERLVFDNYTVEANRVVRNFVTSEKEVIFDGVKEINDLKARVAALEAKSG